MRKLARIFNKIQDIFLCLGGLVESVAFFLKVTVVEFFRDRGKK